MFDMLTRTDRAKPYGKSKLRERRRRAIRERNLNKADPELTGEGAITSWDEKKGKVLYKFMNDFVNVNRLVRKPIPPETKKEHLEKTKEMNLYLANKFRRENGYNRILKEMSVSVRDSAKLLPNWLRDEVINCRFPYLLKEGPDDSIPEYDKLVKRMRFTSESLFLEQKLRIMPDTARMAQKVLVNSYRGDPVKEVPKEIKKFKKQVRQLQHF